MIKKFSEFINESQSTPSVKTVIESGVYGDTLFESITSSLMDEINDSINEGKISLTSDDILNEGFFTNLFKGAAKKAGQEAAASGAKKEYFQNLTKEIKSGTDIIKLGASIKKEEISEDAWKTIEKICNDGVALCEKIAKKEQDVNLAITKKLTETKQAIADFVEKSQAYFKELAEKSENKIVDLLAALRAFLAKLAEFSKKAMENVYKGSIIAVCLPFVLGYSVYKSVAALCEKLCDKSKEIWGEVKNTLAEYGKVVSEWFKTQLNTLKETLKKWSDKAKNEGEKVIQQIAKAYLYIVGVCGLVIDKTSTAVKDAFNSFVESAKGYSEKVKAYIADRWEKVSSWTSQKSGEFVDGVKSVWDAFTKKVGEIVDSAVEGYNKLVDFGSEKVDQIEKWTDDKQKSFGKATVQWMVDKFGADTVREWIG